MVSWLDLLAEQATLARDKGDLAPDTVPSQHEELTLDTFTVLFSVSYSF